MNSSTLPEEHVNSVSVDPAKRQRRWWVVSNYLTREIITDVLDSRANVKRYAAIMHDSRDGADISTHGHVVMELQNPTTGSAVQNMFPVDVIVKPIIGKSGDKFAFITCVRYLTHEHRTQQEKGKFRYPDDEVFASDGFDWRSAVNALNARQGMTDDGAMTLEKLLRIVLQGEMSPDEAYAQYPELCLKNMTRIESTWQHAIRLRNVENSERTQRMNAAAAQEKAEKEAAEAAVAQEKAEKKAAEAQRVAAEQEAARRADAEAKAAAAQAEADAWAALTDDERQAILDEQEAARRAKVEAREIVEMGKCVRLFTNARSVRSAMSSIRREMIDYAEELAESSAAADDDNKPATFRKEWGFSVEEFEQEYNRLDDGFTRRALMMAIGFKSGCACLADAYMYWGLTFDEFVEAYPDVIPGVVRHTIKLYDERSMLVDRQTLAAVTEFNYYAYELAFEHIQNNTNVLDVTSNKPSPNSWTSKQMLASFASGKKLTEAAFYKTAGIVMADIEEKDRIEAAELARDNAAAIAANNEYLAQAAKAVPAAEAAEAAPAPKK